MANDTEVGLEPRRNTLAAVAAGVLVVIAGFLVYNYFSRVGKETTPKISQEGGSVVNEGELVLPQPKELGNNKEEAVGGTVAEEESGAKESVSVTETWVARDFSPDSLSGDSYTVQSGDTLWEIAEARYGSGFAWGRILEANKDKVGFLPDGSQALISPGQALALPS